MVTRKIQVTRGERPKSAKPTPVKTPPKGGKPPRQAYQQRRSERESELLLEINRGLSDEEAARYRELMKRRQAGDLTPSDHRELLDLSDEVERLQAERIGHLADLARLRGKSLGALMEELGIRPSSNA